MFFYLSLGTNIAPEQNAVAMARALIRHFGPIYFYPFRWTAPENMASDKPFLNGLCVISAKSGAQHLKTQLNQIESDLGRDRNDPKRSEKDRTADLDIIGFSHRFDVEIFRCAPEPYVSGLLDGDARTADLREHGLPATESPTTIDLDGSTGHVVVVDDGIDGFHHDFKAALPRQ